MGDHRQRAAVQRALRRPRHAAGLRTVGVCGRAAQATAFGEDAYPTIHEKAAALLHSLARNHPFVDGNKRIGDDPGQLAAFR
jgi:prophage maintenance system killer protein